MADTETPSPQAPVRRFTMPFTLLLGLTLLLYVLGVPLAYGMLLSGPAAIVLGVCALWSTRRDPASGYFRLSMTFGMIVAGFMTVTGMGLVLFHDIATELSDCMNRAVTHSAAQACEAEYQDALEAFVDDVYERFGVTPQQ